MGLVEIGERIKEQDKDKETDYSFLFEEENAPVQDQALSFTLTIRTGSFPIRHQEYCYMRSFPYLQICYSTLKFQESQQLSTPTNL